MGIFNGVLRRCAAGGLACGVMLIGGCHVGTHKNGNDEDVKIATPFGGMSVKTNESVVEGGVGLTVYPGATLSKKNEGHDDGAADVNMNFGSFHLGVKALSYKTTDPPDRVIAFYRKDMARYGVVLLCRSSRAVGMPDRTQDGLSCEHESKSQFQVNEEQSAHDELKAGSKVHQHIVAIDPDGSGTKIGLVALDLPGKMVASDHDDGQ